MQEQDKGRNQKAAKMIVTTDPDQPRRYNTEDLTRRPGSPTLLERLDMLTALASDLHAFADIYKPPSESQLDYISAAVERMCKAVENGERLTVLSPRRFANTVIIKKVIARLDNVTVIEDEPPTSVYAAIGKELREG